MAAIGYGGYYKWRLPTRYELSLLYNLRDELGLYYSDNKFDYFSHSYWSSEKPSSYEYYYYSFTNNKSYVGSGNVPTKPQEGIKM